MSVTKDRKTGFFHALSRAIRYENEPISGTVIKSSHNIITSEVWDPETNLPYVDATNIVDFSGRSDITFYQNQPLTMVPGSNGESYFIDDGGEFIKSWISPTDLADPVSGTPSTIIDIVVYDRYGYLVNSSNGYYSVDFYAGLLKFEYGNTPKDIISDSPPFTNTLMSQWQEGGIGTGDTLFVDVYVYTGPRLDSISSTSLSGLTDVEFTTLVSGQTLVYSGGSWINSYVSGSTDLSNYYTSAETNAIFYTSVETNAIFYTSAQTDVLLANKSDITHNHALSGLSDTNFISLVSGQTIVYSGGTWVNYYISGDTTDLTNYWTSGQTIEQINTAVSGVNSLYKLNDVDSNITTASDGDSLVWSGGTNKWVASDARVDLENYYTTAQTNAIFYTSAQTNVLFSSTGHSHFLTGLTDVSSVTALDGQFLQFSGGTWIPTTTAFSGSYVNTTGDTMTGELSFSFMTGGTFATYTGDTGLTYYNKNLYVDSGGTLKEGSNIVSFYFTDNDLITFITSGDTGWSGNIFTDTGITGYTLLDGQRYIDGDYTYEYFEGTLYRTYYASKDHNHNDLYYTQYELLIDGVLDTRYIRTSANTYLSDLGDVNIVDGDLSGTSYLKYNVSSSLWEQEDIDFSIYAIDDQVVHNIREVNTGAKLTGGGNLNSNRTISHASATTTATEVTPTLTSDVILTMTSDGYGHITAYSYGSISSIIPTELDDLDDVTITTPVLKYHILSYDGIDMFRNVPLIKSMITDFDESYYVNTATTQIIGGDKTFTDTVTLTDFTINEDVYIGGDLYVAGSATTIYTAELRIKDPIITLNSGQTTGHGVIGGKSGIEIIRGLEPNYVLLLDEIQGGAKSFRVGETGDTQAVATRQDDNVIVDGGVAYWNAVDKRFDTTIGVIITGGTLILAHSGTTGLQGGNSVENEFYHTTELQHYGLDILDGMSLDKASFNTYSIGGTIVLDIENINGGDMLFMIDGVEATLDCTTGIGSGGTAQVDLIEGSDVHNPITNYIYVTESGGTAILSATTSLPIGAFGWIGKVILPDVTSFDSYGAYGLQRYTESFNNNDRGALSHQREKLRALGAVYIEGCDQTLNITTTATTVDTVHLRVTTGSVYQLHRQTFPTFTTGPYQYGNGALTIYSGLTHLGEITTYSDGTTPIADDDRINLVIWGAINYSEGDCKLFVNLPRAGYTSDPQALADINNTADYSVPLDMRSVAFMISRIVLRYDSASGGTWTEVPPAGVFSILGQAIGVRSGGASSVASNEFEDGLFRVFNSTDPTKLLSFDLSGITTSTTRTYTWQDKDGTVALLSDALWQRSGTTVTLTNTGDTVNINILNVSSDVNISGSTTIEGITIINNTLNVTGAVDFDSILEVSGITNLLNNVNITGNINVSGNTTIEGIITINSATTINSTLFVSDNVTLSGGSFGLTYGTTVNEISTDSGFTSTSNDQIATTQAIKDYVIASVLEEDIWDRNSNIIIANDTGDTLVLHSGFTLGGYNVNEIVDVVNDFDSETIPTENAVKSYYDYTLGDMYIVNSGETVTVPSRFQAMFYGDLTLNTGAELDMYDDLVMLNGSINLISGSSLNQYSGSTIKMIEFFTKPESDIRYYTKTQVNGLISGATETPGGSDKNIQFNSGDTFAGVNTLVYDYDIDSFKVGNHTINSGNSAAIAGSGNTINHQGSVVIGGYDFTSLDVNTIYIPMLEVFTNGEGMIMRSPSGIRYKITVDNSGNLISTSV